MRYIVYVFIGAMLLLSCSTGNSRREEAERLNHMAYGYRYTSLDSLEHYASEALKVSSDYDTGKAEAYNSLALAAFMRQDFESSSRYFLQSISSSSSRIEQLISYTGLMRLCQRIASNRLFFDYLNKADELIVLLNEERSSLSEHDLRKLVMAESEYHFSLATYYYYMQQDDLAAAQIEDVDLYQLSQADTLEYIYGQYMYSLRSPLDSRISDREDTFSMLVDALVQSRRLNAVYMEGNLLEQLSYLLSDAVLVEHISEKSRAILSYVNPGEVPDSLISLSLAKESLECFRDFGDYLQISSAYRTLAMAYFRLGEYKTSLEILKESLGTLNDCIANYNGKSVTRLEACEQPDSISLEKQWLSTGKVVLCPSWISAIRESLSMAYAALGDKASSDFNRNIYLDILDYTRQDEEMESRLETLSLKKARNGQILVGSIAFVVAGVVLLVIFFLHSRKRNNRRMRQLGIIARMASKITSSVPSSVETAKDVSDSIVSSVEDESKQLFGCRLSLSLQTGSCDDEDTIGNVHDDYVSYALGLDGREPRTDEKPLLDLIRPFVDWAMAYGQGYVRMSESSRDLEMEKEACLMHLAQEKRKNLSSRAIFSIVQNVTPFMDRIINEIRRISDDLPEDERRERFTYLRELVDRVNELNDIMSRWIGLSRGEISLRIESFPLAPLFSTLAKGKRMFEQKDIKLEVEDTDLNVKADSSLTLFMLNTLMENARKYTPGGGTVRISAKEADDYVELSVSDTGIGLTEEDRNTILNEKVYDSSRIGISSADSQKLLSAKGHGFGLMNCKGIIDKYRKSSSIFNVCIFGIESQIGKGSRFFFRLPKAASRVLIVLFLMFFSMKAGALNTDSLSLAASHYADMAYYSNVDGNHEMAVEYADSSCICINSIVASLDSLASQMDMHSGYGLAELQWWKDSISVDYHVILDIRNEAAVASLALGKWDDYEINNKGYTRLYKLLGEDKQLPRFCMEMQEAAATRQVAVTLVLLSFVVFLLVYLSIYLRTHILNRIILRHSLDVERMIIEAAAIRGDDLDASQVAERIVSSILPAVNDVQKVEDIAVLLYDEKGRIAAVSATGKDLGPALSSLMETVSLACKKTGNIYPLGNPASDGHKFYGAISFTGGEAGGKLAEIFFGYIVQYISAALYELSVKLDERVNDIDILSDEKNRIEHEEKILHVGNLVLDNCFSSLKHETMYYPSRISQIVSQILSRETIGDLCDEVKDMDSLMSYYREVYLCLSSLASRELEHSKFSRRPVSSRTLMEHASQYLAKRSRKLSVDSSISCSDEEVNLRGDEDLLKYLMECLIDTSIFNCNGQSVELSFSFSKIGNLVAIEAVNRNGMMEKERLDTLFYPLLRNMPESSDNMTDGHVFLIMRQIVREHEELCGIRGCGIEALACGEGGYLVRIKLPGC